MTFVNVMRFMIYFKHFNEVDNQRKFPSISRFI